MTKPEDIPQDVWDASFAALLPIVRNQYETSPMAMVQHLGIARAILAERERALEEAAVAASGGYSVFATSTYGRGRHNAATAVRALKETP